MEREEKYFLVKLRRDSRSLVQCGAYPICWICYQALVEIGNKGIRLAWSGSAVMNNRLILGLAIAVILLGCDSEPVFLRNEEAKTCRTNCGLMPLDDNLIFYRIRRASGGCVRADYKHKKMNCSKQIIYRGTDLILERDTYFSGRKIPSGIAGRDDGVNDECMSYSYVYNIKLATNLGVCLRGREMSEYVYVSTNNCGSTKISAKEAKEILGNWGFVSVSTGDRNL